MKPADFIVRVRDMIEQFFAPGVVQRAQPLEQQATFVSADIQSTPALNLLEVA
ncbi:hypothetical protein [Oceaniovalibus sp. ACAM 378]|uniref:hypothetical protein n=1 Tax=Oceaniovalibus sp. ACAM 378 TaxID=2599923 RepID=UPI0016521290|nr:hypothetical protein [Oceaniovalibus sp. ACAM 378]